MHPWATTKCCRRHKTGLKSREVLSPGRNDFAAQIIHWVATWDRAA